MHLAYGGLPNMSWVLGRGGLILYKAMWTSADRIGDFLDRFQAQPLDLVHAPFHTEQLEVRRRDSQEFTRGLQHRMGRGQWRSSLVPRSSGASGHEPLAQGPAT